MPRRSWAWRPAASSSALRCRPRGHRLHPRTQGRQAPRGHPQPGVRPGVRLRGDRGPRRGPGRRRPCPRRRRRPGDGRDGGGLDPADPPGRRRGGRIGRPHGTRLPRRPSPPGAGPGRRPPGVTADGLIRGTPTAAPDAAHLHDGGAASPCGACVRGVRDPRAKPAQPERHRSDTVLTGPRNPTAAPCVSPVDGPHIRLQAIPGRRIATMGSPEPDRGTRIAHEEPSCQTRPST